jgi:hypothetical protein
MDRPLRVERRAPAGGIIIDRTALFNVIPDAAK